jgi:hypothetical protein
MAETATISTWLLKWLPVLGGFSGLVAVTGLAGRALRHWTRRRHDSRVFADAASKMPALFRDIKSDLERDGQEFTRQFFVLANPRVMLTRVSGGDFFVYYESEHDALLDKVRVLEGIGYVRDVTRVAGVPKYVMSDGFVALLRASAPPA